MKTAPRGGFLLPAQFCVFPQFPAFSFLACAKFVPKNERELDNGSTSAPDLAPVRKACDLYEGVNALPTHVDLDVILGTGAP
jgi:hypothetical protein